MQSTSWIFGYVNKPFAHTLYPWQRRSKGKQKKRNFSETEIEVLTDEVDGRKGILVGSHSTGISNKRKGSEWLSVATAVNAASATERAVSEIKKKRSDLKVDPRTEEFVNEVMDKMDMSVVCCSSGSQTSQKSENYATSLLHASIVPKHPPSSLRTSISAMFPC